MTAGTGAERATAVAEAAGVGVAFGDGDGFARGAGDGLAGGGGDTGLGVVVVASCIQAGTCEDLQADSATMRTARQNTKATRGTKKPIS